MLICSNYSAVETAIGEIVDYYGYDERLTFDTAVDPDEIPCSDCYRIKGDPADVDEFIRDLQSNEFSEIIEELHLAETGRCLPNGEFSQYFSTHHNFGRCDNGERRLEIWIG